MDKKEFPVCEILSLKFKTAVSKCKATDSSFLNDIVSFLSEEEVKSPLSLIMHLDIAAEKLEEQISWLKDINLDIVNNEHTQHAKETLMSRELDKCAKYYGRTHTLVKPSQFKKQNLLPYNNN